MPYSDSEIVEGGELILLGVWIHDPEDAEGTSTQYLYGKSARSTSIDVLGVQQVYAGRRYPVYEYGEHQLDKFSVTMQIPHGPTWSADVRSIRDFSESKRTLHFRDNRGRSSFGVMDSYQEADQDWGTQVGFNWTRVDRLEVEA